jgi:hypothetical protein
VADLLLVLTARRWHGKNFLNQTIKSLEAAGASAMTRIIYSDGPIDLTGSEYPAWGLVEDGEECSNNPTDGARRAMAYALACDCDHLVFCEDDIVMRRGGIETIANTPVPDNCAFVSFSNPRTGQRGLHIVPAGEVRDPQTNVAQVWGAWCLKIPRRFLERLVVEMPGECKATDVAIGQVAMRSPWPRYAIVVPNLVQHVGWRSEEEGRHSVTYRE